MRTPLTYMMLPVRALHERVANEAASLMGRCPWTRWSGARMTRTAMEPEGP